MIFVKIREYCPGSPDWKKISQYSRESDQNRVYTTKKGLIFCVLSASLDQIQFGIAGDILKNPTLHGAKNINKLRVPSHWATWIPQTV